MIVFFPLKSGRFSGETISSPCILIFKLPDKKYIPGQSKYARNMLLILPEEKSCVINPDALVTFVQKEAFLFSCLAANKFPFEILENKSHFSFKEGCLSVPGFYEEISRPDKIKLSWQDVDGKSHTSFPEGLLTVCIQHEIDHLEGKLMVDYVSRLKRERIKKKAAK